MIIGFSTNFLGATDLKNICTWISIRALSLISAAGMGVLCALCFPVCCGGGCSGWMFIAARDTKQKAKSHTKMHTHIHERALIYLPTNVKPIETIFIRSRSWWSECAAFGWELSSMYMCALLLRREVWLRGCSEREAAWKISSRKISPHGSSKYSRSHHDATCVWICSAGSRAIKL